MKLFWFLWSIDAIIAAFVLYFFVVGLSDGTVTNRNGMMWFLLLLLPGCVLEGSIYFMRLPKWSATYVVRGVVVLPQQFKGSVQRFNLLNIRFTFIAFFMKK